MKHLLILTAFAAALCLPYPSSAGTVAPNKPSELRTFVGTPNTSLCPGLPSFHTVELQQNPNGTVTTGFSIPERSVFVVTSFDVTGTNPVGQTSSTALFVSDGAGATSFIARCGGIVGGDGQAFASCTIPFGVPVKRGVALCFSPATSNVIVRGFIAKDK